jgi:protein-tyrosine-phosphatase
LKDKVEKNEALRGKVCVYSCGTDAENGDPASGATIQTMKERGIDCTGHRATSMYHSAIADTDLVLCAEKDHKELVIKHFPALMEKGNVYTVREYVKDKNATNINDPYGGDMNVYRRCASEIEDCLDKLLAQLIVQV